METRAGRRAQPPDYGPKRAAVGWTWPTSIFAGENKQSLELGTREARAPDNPDFVAKTRGGCGLTTALNKLDQARRGMERRRRGLSAGAEAQAALDKAQTTPRRKRELQGGKREQSFP